MLRWRLGRHLLAGPPAADVVTVARRVCGVHAQLTASAETAVRLRAGVATGAVDDALLATRSLVKLWAARGTLHLIAADDLPT